MPEQDKDLRSIQQAREMVLKAREAQQVWANATQEEVDRVCAAMADVAFQASERLGRMAAEETGFGVPEHKKLKKGTISRRGKIKGQIFSIMGLSNGMPQHFRFYSFTYQAKTYIVNVIMTTTAHKHEPIAKMVDGMISGMLTWKP